ncbi:hypothetical protein DAPPUDRAFT_267494 [Daphnia pulex]|uniref:Peptidase C19 ubiquitin carboxyl-terminal hydrolase domain-containing protein n=1 Tax=Daphnia pulex TaxID=6669 RepID=E9HWK8_DAPPU|nr:hypothetical protein DAPPUDRAFT_267494 [Daphnia pulex]|eukprot:EFX63873.1 hypothetical protein DAPPUDRAFT_267494 [Daphnia pulex]
MAKRGASDQKLVNVMHSDVMQHVTQLLDPLYGLGRQQDAHELFVRIFQYCAEKLPVVMPAVLQDQFENFVFQEVICQRVLIICLKMFANGTKIGVKIAFLEVWQSFADEEDDGPQYMLQAHITHFGDSVNSGHCICQSRQNDGIIRRFDDERVSTLPAWNADTTADRDTGDESIKYRNSTDSLFWRAPCEWATKKDLFPSSTDISLGYPGDGLTDELDVQCYVPWTSSDNPNVATPPPTD